MNSESQTLQTLADELFVSRSTVENDFLIVRNQLKKLGIKVEVDHHGIHLAATENQRREAIAELISHYWGREIYAEPEHGQLVRSINLPTKLEQLFSKKIISLVMAALAEFIDKSRLTFSDYEFQSLAIHLMIALERISKTKTQSAMPKGKQHNLRDETKLLIKIVERRYQHELPVAEQNYLDLHIVAALHKKVSLTDVKSSENETSSDEELREVSAFLKHELMAINPDHELLEGLTLHLESTIKRLKVGLNIYNPYTEEVRRNLPEAFDAAVHLQSAIQTKYHITLNDDELAFIALHFQSFYERHLTDDRIKVVVVCSSGIGTSQLLAQRLEQRFGKSLRVVRVTTVAEVFTSKLDEDLVISTIPISKLDKPIICIGPLLTSKDSELVQMEITRLQSKRHPENVFFELLKPDLVFIDPQVKTARQAVNEIVQGLERNGNVTDTKQIMNAVEKREELASTAIAHFSLPHVGPELIKRSALALFISPQAISWQGSQVNFILFIALNNKVKSNMKEIFKVINTLIDDQHIQNQLLKVASSKQAVEVLKHWNRRGM